MADQPEPPHLKIEIQTRGEDIKAVVSFVENCSWYGHYNNVVFLQGAERETGLAAPETLYQVMERHHAELQNSAVSQCEHCQCEQ